MPSKIIIMHIRKVDVRLTERDISRMLETVCKEVQSTQKSNDIADLFSELLLNSTEGSSMFVQIMLGNGLPKAAREGDVVRCNWDRLKIGLNEADEIHKKLKENNLINSRNEVTCKIKSFKGYTAYFPYSVEFKYGDDLYVAASMGFEDLSW
jgi:hypothetical protein